MGVNASQSWNTFGLNLSTGMETIAVLDGVFLILTPTLEVELFSMGAAIVFPDAELT